MRLRAWYPVQRVQNALPSHRAAQGVVVGACGLSVFFARPPVLCTPPARAVFSGDVRFCIGCSHEQQQTHLPQASRFQR
jgi:hypothetical protein